MDSPPRAPLSIRLVDTVQVSIDLSVRSRGVKGFETCDNSRTTSNGLTKQKRKLGPGREKATMMNELFIEAEEDDSPGSEDP
jgi:hypothetical protein